MPNNHTYRFSERKMDGRHHRDDGHHHHHDDQEHFPLIPYPPYRRMPPWFWLLDAKK